MRLISPISLISLILVTAFALYPLLKGSVIAGHDAGYHFTRVQLFTQALKQGQFPVRWIEGPVEGLSHPLFEFYPPLFYYAAAGFNLIGFSYVTATYLTIFAATLIGWLGMYFFIRYLSSEIYHLRSDIPAIISASLFILSPYRLSQLYVRATFVEYLATAFIPWAFWAVATGRPFFLAISLAAILLSHQPTLIMIALPLLAWIILLRRFKTGLFGLLAAIGLSASFLFPMLGERQFIRSSQLQSGYFDFRQHFATLQQLIYSPWDYGVSRAGPEDSMSFQLGILNWVVLLAAIAASYKSYKSHKTYTTYMIAVTLFALFMSTSASLPIWERFADILGFIQYPWRFLAVATFATAALAAVLPNRFPSRFWPAAILIAILFNFKYIAPAAYLPRPTFDLGNPELAKYNSPDNPYFGVELGYLPIYTLQLATTPPAQKFQIVTGQADLQPQAVGITRQSFAAKSSQTSVIRINTHYFPGWTAIINGQTTTPAYNNPEGFMEITLPPGQADVTLRLTPTPLRRLADYLSLGTALGLAGWFIFSRSRFWSKYSGAIRLAPK